MDWLHDWLSCWVQAPSAAPHRRASSLRSSVPRHGRTVPPHGIFKNWSCYTKLVLLYLLQLPRICTPRPPGYFETWMDCWNSNTAYPTEEERFRTWSSWWWDSVCCPPEHYYSWRDLLHFVGGGVMQLAGLVVACESCVWAAKTYGGANGRGWSALVKELFLSVFSTCLLMMHVQEFQTWWYWPYGPGHKK